MSLAPEDSTLKVLIALTSTSDEPLALTTTSSAVRLSAWISDAPDKSKLKFLTVPDRSALEAPLSSTDIEVALMLSRIKLLAPDKLTSKFGLENFPTVKSTAPDPWIISRFGAIIFTVMS